MPYKEKEIEKLYFTMKEVTEMLEVPPSMIRFWEKEFNELKPKKNKRGVRYFTQQDVSYLKLIYHYTKEKGYTLEGVKLKLKESKGKVPDKFHAIDSLKQVKSFLEELRNKLV